MRAHLLAVVAALTLWGCIGPEDNPTTVHDLRVLGVALEPPELMAPACPGPESTPQDLLAILMAFSQPIELRALIVDPAAQGRSISYELWLCADPSDRDCSVEEERALLGQGETTGGVLATQLTPATAVLPDGTAALERVVENDAYFGLGGIRVPLVLHLRAGAEDIWAQKLMVYNCPLVPGMVQNVTPVLPGVTLGGQTLEEGVPMQLGGAGPFELSPLDFAALQEPYVVPSFALEPVALEERWRLAWYTDHGTFSPGQTGGADIIDEDPRHDVEWNPPPGSTEERDVRFWVVTRDGRGGLSWIERVAHYRP